MLQLTDPRLRTLMMHCKTMEFWNKDTILKQGEPGDCFYILMEGEVQILVDGKVVATQAADADHGKVYYFGEVALLEGTTNNRNSTVRVVSTCANLVCVSKDNINDTFGSVKALLEEQHTSAAEQIEQSGYKVEKAHKRTKAELKESSKADDLNKQMLNNMHVDKAGHSNKKKEAEKNKKDKSSKGKTVDHELHLAYVQ